MAAGARRQGNKLLYLGNPEARQWLDRPRQTSLLTEQGIDLYRQDFNFEPARLSGAPTTPPTGRASRRSATLRVTWLTGTNCDAGFPAMLIDTCATGGRRDDLETLRRAVPLWRSDYGLTIPPPCRI